MPSVLTNCTRMPVYTQVGRKYISGKYVTLDDRFIAENGKRRVEPCCMATTPVTLYTRYSCLRVQNTCIRMWVRGLHSRIA